MKGRHSSVSLVLIDVVVEELGDEVDVREDHASAAVPLQAQLVKGLPICHYLLILCVLSYLASTPSLSRRSR